jgi:hypothetical protein
MTLTLLFLLYFYREDCQRQFVYLFAADGMWLAFFDFLTYPLVAFSVPLLVYFLLSRKNTLKEQLIQGVRYGVAFGIGYGGLWSLKWVYASLLTDENVIADGIANTLHRVGAVEMSEDVLFENTPWAAIKNNLKTVMNIQTLCIVLLFILLLIGYYARKKGSFTWNKKMSFFCILVGISPFLWYILVYNHCALHLQLEWRELAIFVFAAAVWLINIKEEKRVRTNGERE